MGDKRNRTEVTTRVMASPGHYLVPVLMVNRSAHPEEVMKTKNQRFERVQLVVVRLVCDKQGLKVA